MVGLNHLCMHYGVVPISNIFVEVVVVSWSIAFLCEFQQAADAPRPATVSSSAVKWQPPLAGCAKHNSDTALDSSRSLVGVGLVLRDVEGRVLGSSWQREAVLGGLKFALDIGVSSIVVESNASSLVDLINGKVVAFHEIGVVMDEIQSLCSNFQSC
ncbi:hypothetical protein ACOSQ2_007720 [Xanthoceras sorbifolium]